MMTFLALPWTMSVAKYGVLLLLIVVVVPAVISLLERRGPLRPLTVGDDAGACALPVVQIECTEGFRDVARGLAGDYLRNVWMLARPTLTLMLLASLASAVLLVLIPWESLLARPTPLRMGLVSLVSVAMPVPIALDVMFAAQLQRQGAPAGYVMTLAMTLGTYSVIPAVYLWREVSRRLSVILFAFFVAVGWAFGLMF